MQILSGFPTNFPEKPRFSQHLEEKESAIAQVVKTKARSSWYRD
ncbi:hypothetical protein QUA20_21340 [Microcoleus sp. Pol7_A1]